MPAIRFTKGRARVYLKAINNWKKKTMSVEELSLEVGIYEDVIRDQLASFDPLIRIMVDVDVIALKPELEKYIAAKTVKRKTTRRKKPHPKYKSVVDFVYRNMTVPGGLINSAVNLSFNQLKDLKKLVNEEYKAKKEK